MGEVCYGMSLLVENSPIPVPQASVSNTKGCEKSGSVSIGG